MDDNRILIAKLPASCSGIHQASDCSPAFRAAKGRLATAVAEFSIQANLGLVGWIEQSLDTFEHFNIAFQSLMTTEGRLYWPAKPLSALSEVE